MSNEEKPPAKAAEIGTWNWRRFVPTNWQSIASTVAIALAAFALNYLKATPDPVPVPDIPTPVFEGEMGWVEPRERDREEALATDGVVLFSNTPANALTEDEVGDADGNVYLWKLAAKARGQNIPTLNQGRVGSCVGHGFATGITYVVAVQAALRRGPPIDGTVTVAPEVVYGGSRVNANGGRSPIFGDGSNGSWAARFVTTDGCVTRGKYGDYDVSKYDEAQCRRLGREGIKGDLLLACRKNTVGSAALVKTTAEAKKAISQGYTIPICSTVGFAGQSSRDADGFLQARGIWPHCMVLIGYRKDRDAYYCMNSWGEKWVGGPTGAGDPPPGGFWIDSATVARILGQGDSYALSDVRGFPRRKIDATDWTRALPRHDNNRDFDRVFALCNLSFLETR